MEILICAVGKYTANYAQNCLLFYKSLLKPNIPSLYTSVLTSRMTVGYIKVSNFLHLHICEV